MYELTLQSCAKSTIIRINSPIVNYKICYLSQFCSVIIGTKNRKEPGAIKENFAREMLLFQEDTSSISSACATAVRMSELAMSTIRVYEEMMALVLKKQQQQVYLQSLSVPRRRWGNVIKKIITQNKVAKMTVFIDEYYQKIGQEGFSIDKATSQQKSSWTKDSLSETQPFLIEKENTDLKANTDLNEVDLTDSKGEYLERNGIQLFLPQKVTAPVRRKSTQSPEVTVKSAPGKDNLFSNLCRVSRGTEGSVVRTGREKEREKEKERDASPRKIAFGGGQGDILKIKNIKRESSKDTSSSGSNSNPNSFNRSNPEPLRKAALPRLSSHGYIETKTACEGSLPISFLSTGRGSPSTLPIIKTQKEIKSSFK